MNKADVINVTRHGGVKYYVVVFHRDHAGDRFAIGGEGKPYKPLKKEVGQRLVHGVRCIRRGGQNDPKSTVDSRIDAFLAEEYHKRR